MFRDDTLNYLLGCIAETTWKCPLGFWRCNDLECIRSEYICDGLVDCFDESDEASSLCNQSKSMLDRKNCIHFQTLFKCIDRSMCLSFKRLCNGVQDCVDGSDERSCASQFKSCFGAVS
ncbi:hypothetical protein HELRODRAFT_62198 [Helobdella robusta]|uniref:Uncharacterized protein n=1 Tax=Helobdella robusta TaxID=6412 RepID=T1FWW9_HELRO|nr:hypothetical protein HELRODRAFT_62198 [Helobdella robusta]ESO12228.1 hypothetical protein HELRODRAFT_62198 [Helobdella robusta]